MATERMTNRKAINFVLDNYDVPTEVEAKFRSMLAALDRKSSTERKPTAKQVENAGLRAVIVDFIKANADGTENGGFTVTELIKSIDEIAECSNQKVSAILRLAVEDKALVRKSVKRHTYFCPAE
jgi:hypothetical protein